MASNFTVAEFALEPLLLLLQHVSTMRFETPSQEKGEEKVIINIPVVGVTPAGAVVAKTGVRSV